MVSILGPFIAAKYGSKYQSVKSKAGETVKLLQAVTDAANSVYEAAKDDMVSEEEFQGIADSAKKVLEAVEAIKSL